VIEAAHGNTAAAIEQLAAAYSPYASALAPDAARMIAEGLYGDAAAHARAVDMLERAAAEHPPPDTPGIVPSALLMLGESRRALGILTDLPKHNRGLTYFQLWLPKARELRALPEFKTFTRKIGLVELWDKHGAPDLCRRVAAGEYACD
jgi:hypothetical protein